MGEIENMYEDIGGEEPRFTAVISMEFIPTHLHIHIYLPVNGDGVGLRDKTPPELRWAFFYDSLV